jgi:hypothetical protein
MPHYGLLLYVHTFTKRRNRVGCMSHPRRGIGPRNLAVGFIKRERRECQALNDQLVSSDWEASIA